jgi:SAM-dependent methyltransferase
LATMHSSTIQHQYDEVIASHYDVDPHSVVGDSLDKAIWQIRRQKHIGSEVDPLAVLDLGLGTGRFLEKLGQHIENLQPFGIDISQKMIEIAHTRVPDLVSAIDDAANLDSHFEHESFDLVCTHFVTGFVPMRILAPKIHDKLTEAGYWSLVAGTAAGFPKLHAKAKGWLIKALFGGKDMNVQEMVCNPADHGEIVRTLEQHGFEVREWETFQPRLQFRNMADFMEFAYYGGWLTPFIERLGLHRAGWMTRAALNLALFPTEDHHSIEIVLAQKRTSSKQRDG